MDNFVSLNEYFSEKLKHLTCDENTKNYIVGILSKYKTSYYDLSKSSITQEFATAKLNNNFEKFQTVGDWIFYSETFFPESLKAASNDYYFTLGQVSYLNCYKIVRRWKVYEILAENLIDLTKSSRQILLQSEPNFIDNLFS